MEVSDVIRDSKEREKREKKVDRTCFPQREKSFEVKFLTEIRELNKWRVG